MKLTPLITKSEIKSMCGSAYYSRGKGYFEGGKVKSLVEVANGSVDGVYKWRSEVQGRRNYTVTVAISRDDIKGSCNCPAFDKYDDACKHVAAVLFAVEAEKLPAVYKSRATTQSVSPVPTTTKVQSAAPSGGTSRVDSPSRFESGSGSHRGTNPNGARRFNDLSDDLLSLFRWPQQSNLGSELNALQDGRDRELLRVEFICRLQGTTHMWSDHIKLEMKIGPLQTYVVKSIRNLLQVIEDGRQYLFTQKFTYDPALHYFSPEDSAVIAELQKIVRQETMMRDLVGHRFSYRESRMNDERALVIPSPSWPDLLQKLLQSRTTLMYNGEKVPLQVGKSGLPLTASVSSSGNDMYTLELDGLKELLFLPEYELVVSSTSIHQIDPLVLHQLSSLQAIMDIRNTTKIDFSVDALEPIMNEVLPQVKRVAAVQVDKGISKRIIEAPLEAQLYLDKDAIVLGGETTDLLTARLKFVYGDTVILPYSADQSSDETVGVGATDEDTPIVIRDLSTEQRILHMLDECPFHRESDTESIYILGEEDIYLFLFKQMPLLRELVQVYATSAVDSWVKPSSFTPKTRVELDERTNWLEVSFDMGDLDDKEILRVLQSMIERKKYHRLSDGTFLSLEDASFGQISDLVETLNIRPTELKQTKFQLPALRALALMDNEHTDVHTASSVKLGKSLRRWLDNLRNPDNLETPLPEGIDATLREYQVFGFQWMKTLAKYQFGGILADDMGLGKTLQSIAYLLSEKHDVAAVAGEQTMALGTATQPSLIVCPASLTFNWLNEIDRFAPQLKAAVVVGTKEERQDILDSYSQYDVLITSYPLLWRDIDSYTGVKFSSLILDEAQAIKNHQTQSAQAVFQIQSNHRFALTGTPVENSLDDLWSIFHAVFPELLGGKTAFSQLGPEAIAKRVRPFILRRLKRDVLKELPDKIEILQTSELTTDQKKYYMAYLAQLQQDTMKGLEQEGFQKGRFRILSGITRLRQLCCHPSLCIENYRGQSGKMEQLLELVEDYISSEQRMLIFSQFTSMLEIIRQELTKRGIPYLYLDGQTPTNKRLDLCQQFNNGDTPVFLISLKAGGTGLNLTGADTVILYDLWWNPAVEEQAADRAHRIGQKRNVQVVRMVSKGTIEEKIYQLQERKRSLIDSVVQANEEGLGALTEEDVRELLMI